MTKEECEVRAKAEEKLKAYWETPASRHEISKKALYTKLSADHFELGKKLYEMDKALKALGKEAGLEITDVTKDGDIFCVVERHTKVL